MKRGSKKPHIIVAVMAVFLVAAATAAAFALAASEAEAREQAMPDMPEENYVRLELPDGETRRVWQYRIPSSRYTRVEPVVDPTRPMFTYANPLDARIELPDTGPFSLVEFGVSVDGPRCGFTKMNVGLTDTTGVMGWSGGTSFRRMLTSGGLASITLEPFVDATNDVPDDRDCVLTLVLTRDLNRCSMSATVTGDVAGFYFGDVAYFNTFDETVPMAAGNAMDPGTMALLDQLLAMSGGVTPPANEPPPTQDPPPPGQEPPPPGQEPPPPGQEPPPPGQEPPPPGQEPPPPTQEPPPDRGGVPPDTWGGMLQQWAAESPDDASTPHSGKFGLTLTNGLLPAGGPFGGTAMFSLGAVGPGLETAVERDGIVSVPLTRIDLLPGLDAMEGVKFIWEAGETGRGGDASLTIVPAGENAMIGTLRADLVSEHRYPNRGNLRISLEARFIALRGNLACMR